MGKVPSSAGVRNRILAPIARKEGRFAGTSQRVDHFGRRMELFGGRIKHALKLIHTRCNIQIVRTVVMQCRAF